MKNASFLVKDNTVSVNFPISKSSIDVDKRIVSGWATIDNLDQMGDVVTAEASLKAFNSFRGNVREMHDKFKAVGKVVKFRQQEYYDNNGEPHTGIYVDVYISKGAEDTWQKILDGTLTGFSIYGPVAKNGVVKQYVPDQDKLVSFVVDYSLIELSLVDSPGNELCNILAIQKSADPTGLATKIQKENVFWCENDSMAFVSDSETYPCSICKAESVNLGWFESTGDEAGEIRKILESNEKISKSNELNVTKGGQDMPEREEQEVTATETTNKEVEVVVDDKNVADATTEVTEVAEVNEPDLSDIASALNDIKSTLERSTEEEQQREVALSKVRETVEGVEAKVEKSLQDLLAKHEELAGQFNSLKEGLNTVEKRLGVFEDSTAIKKSADKEDEENTLRKQKPKSVWSNSLLPTNFD